MDKSDPPNNRSALGRYTKMLKIRNIKALIKIMIGWVSEKIAQAEKMKSENASNREMFLDFFF